MSVKSDFSSSSRSKNDEDTSEVDSEDTEESNFVLVEIPHTDQKTFCKLCFRTAQVCDQSMMFIIIILQWYSRLLTVV